MAVTEFQDPRLKALFGQEAPIEDGVKPVVRLPRRGLPTWVIAGIAALFAILLFAVLEARRERQTVADVEGARAAPSVSTVGWDAPPPLIIPNAVPVAPVTTTIIPGVGEPKVVQVVPRPATIAPPPPQIVYAPAPAAQLAPPIPVPPTRTSNAAPLVLDLGGKSAAVTGSASPPMDADSSSGTVARSRASAFANRSMTVPQGHLISAVLETGFNSTQPGFARAIVSRDVRSFDGKNVLIPRGSRLIGDYRSDVAQGQSRAVIRWTRLIRPDGMTIALDSPAVDPLGRGGVPASVNNHFFERLGDALLQSTVELGRAFSGRSVTGPVVVMQDNATNAASRSLATRNFAPTLSVRPGKSISVFVARDLDFSSGSRE